MDYFVSWCLVCEKQLPSGCHYCSDVCQLLDFHDAEIDTFTALRLNKNRIAENEKIMKYLPDEITLQHRASSIFEFLKSFDSFN
jgi:hypothetical protein